MRFGNKNKEYKVRCCRYIPPECKHTMYKHYAVKHIDLIWDKDNFIQGTI